MDDTAYIIDKWKAHLATKSPKDYLALYIHIPFCTSRCNYCMYLSSILKNPEQIDAYLNWLNDEMSLLSPTFSGERISAIYIGGGTPSLMSIDQIKRLMEIIRSHFELDVDDENMFAFEVNPEHLSEKMIDYLASSIFNRVSLGIQSLNANVLKAENRVNPGTARIEKLLRYLIKAFQPKHSRINTDLMIGLKEQTVDSLIEDISVLSDLGVPRITIYANRQVRGPEAQKEFEEYVVCALRYIETFFDKYQIITNSSGFSEPNWLKLKSFRHIFMKPYRTEPLLNSNISFGIGAISLISTQEFCYMRQGNRYKIRHDPKRGIIDPGFSSMFNDRNLFLSKGIEHFDIDY